MILTPATQSDLDIVERGLTIHDQHQTGRKRERLAPALRGGGRRAA